MLPRATHSAMTLARDVSQSRDQNGVGLDNVGSVCSQVEGTPDRMESPVQLVERTVLPSELIWTTKKTRHLLTAHSLDRGTGCELSWSQPEQFMPATEGVPPVLQSAA